MKVESDDFKVCCASFYEQDLVALLLGDDYHPGGQGLTRRLAQLLHLQPGQRVLDVACGRGTTALLLAEEYEVEVVGVDLGAQNLAVATAWAAERGLARLVRFEAGDAESLPLAAGSVDAVVCECALCTFPDKLTAAREMTRVLRRGGQLGLADVTIDPARLDPELRTTAARIACIADARPLDAYEQLLRDAGLQITVHEHHEEALTALIERVEARLAALRILVRNDSVGPDGMRELIRSAARAVRDGHAGYVLLVARKP